MLSGWCSDLALRQFWGAGGECGEMRVLRCSKGQNKSFSLLETVT